MNDATDNIETLSERERAVLRLCAKGLTRAEIAKAESRDYDTIKSQERSIQRKLNIANRWQLIARAARMAALNIL